MTTTDWQPIETAPKDGSKVLLVVRGRVHIGSYFNTVRIEHGVEVSRHEGWNWGDIWLSLYLDKPQPTHWMPLPPVPVPEPAVEESAA